MRRPGWWRAVAQMVGGMVVLSLGACAQERGNADELSSTDPTSTQAAETTRPDEPTTALATTTTAPTTTTSVLAAEPIVLSGGGEVATDPFHLDGGRYAYVGNFGGECFYGPNLKPIDGSFMDIHILPTADAGQAVESNLYDVSPGDYYLDMITGPAPGCPWDITLTPTP